MTIDQQQQYYKFSVISIELWIIMMSGASHYKPVQTVERLFLTACLLANLVLAGSFQVIVHYEKKNSKFSLIKSLKGSLTRSFSTTTFYQDITTLEQLEESGLPIGTASNYMANIFGDDSLPVIKSLQSRIKVLDDSFTLDRTAKNRDMCGIERMTDIKVIIAVC